MLLSKRKQFDECIKLDADGFFYAKYNQLTLTSVYQPIFGQNLEVIGAEALVRIEDKNNEMLRPDLFFFDNKTDCEIKKNVESLSRAMHIRNFHRMGLKNLTLFLNVLPSQNSYSSVKNIANGLLIQRLGELGIGCSQIVLEILEQRTNNESLKEVTDELKAQGFQLAIDDFGKDASDMSRTAILKPHIIKIDKSLLYKFMEGDTKGLLEGIQLAKTMSAKTVIEGVETKAQLNMMQDIGVDMFQGYYLCRPCTAKALKHMFMN